MFCGVVPTPAVTFTAAIPGINYRWQMEIVRRGRAACHFDKNGKISCVWTVKADDK
jgi:hypothetical protein